MTATRRSLRYDPLLTYGLLSLFGSTIIRLLHGTRCVLCLNSFKYSADDDDSLCGSNGFNIYKTSRDRVQPMRCVTLDQHRQIISELWPAIYKINTTVQPVDRFFGNVLKTIRTVNLREGYWKEIVE